MYSVADYLWMLGNSPRSEAYAGAIRAVVRRGDRVLDVGAGFGVFSVLAARAGASHVDAVEPNPAVYLGARVAAANGCASRITFHDCALEHVALERRADVLVADMRGPTPFGSRALEVLILARDRFLRAGGRMVAARDTLYVAPCRAPAVFRREVLAARGQHGLALEPVERVVFDSPVRCPVAPEDLLGPGVAWLELDYYTIGSTDHAGSAECITDRAGVVHGLAVWFVTDLGGGYGFSTEPGGVVDTYRQLFVPFRTPVNVGPGDRLHVALGARQVGSSYLWEWRAALTPCAESTEHLIADQNSLAELVVDPSTFVHTAPSAPQLGPRGRALLQLLGRMSHDRSIAQIAAELRESAPALFPDDGAATAFVTEWVVRLSRFERGAM